MRPTVSSQLYSRREIALAAGVTEAEVRAALGSARELVPHEEAVAIGRLLAGNAAPQWAFANPHLASRHLQSALAAPRSALRIPQRRTVPIALSTTLHVALTALVFLAAFDLAPRAAALKLEDRPTDSLRLVFLATPGPGGGGGGGGLRQKAPAPRALREGRRAINSPMPPRFAPASVFTPPRPPEPKPRPLDAEPLPVVVAPIVAAPADARSRIGVLADTRTESSSRGSGAGGGAGSGNGTGLGEGDGGGVGPGSGGGAGGGPYRPGSGVEPPRLLQEVKASYSEDARRQGIAGDVVLEIVVRRDGGVGDVRVLQGLAGGLNDRAIQAVRQWKFAPAHRFGAAVDVVVEVAVEFKLR